MTSAPREASAGCRRRSTTRSTRSATAPCCGARWATRSSTRVSPCVAPRRPGSGTARPRRSWQRCAGSTEVGTAVLLEGLRLVDHHCHGVVRHELDRPGFEALLSESGPPPPGVTHFDTPLGVAVRRHCAPVLDLDPHSSAEQYLERRSALGVEEVTGRLLRGAGAQALLVDTGYGGEELLSPREVGAAAGADGLEIVRLEAVAEELARGGLEASQFL